MGSAPGPPLATTGSSYVPGATSSSRCRLSGPACGPCPAGRVRFMTASLDYCTGLWRDTQCAVEFTARSSGTGGARGAAGDGKAQHQKSPAAVPGLGSRRGRSSRTRVRDRASSTELLLCLLVCGAVWTMAWLLCSPLRPPWPSPGCAWPRRAPPSAPPSHGRGSESSDCAESWDGTPTRCHRMREVGQIRGLPKSSRQAGAGAARQSPPR